MGSEASSEIDDLLAKAIAHHRNGELSKAEWAYEELLEKAPEHPDAHQLMGVIAAQMGNTSLAIERVNKSLAINPDQPSALNNLGNMLAEENRYDEAIDVYQRAIGLNPDYAEAHYNLGNVFSDNDRLFEAIESYSRSVAVLPEDAAGWHALGTVLEKTARFDEAVAAYRKAKTVDPEFIAALNRLGSVLRKMDRLEEARDVYREWLEVVPDEPIASHFLLVCGDPVVAPQRASQEYVKKTFDDLADDFDSLLSDLDYQAPNLLGEMVHHLVPFRRRGELSVVDLGCGTGLCGRHLCDCAERLVGVDLSASMLDKARERELYDDLIEGELTEYLSGCTDEHDLLVSADTLIYVGDLQTTFAAAAGALRPGGWFVFSLEKLEPGDADDCDTRKGYRLSSSGRYTHLESRVRRWLSDNGFTVNEFVEAKVREEGLNSTTGFLISAVRD